MVLPLSIYNCNQYKTTLELSCRFKDVSPCGEQISKYICNEHAAIFQLTYQFASYTNGNNEQWHQINTYINTDTNFNLPLFKDSSNTIIQQNIEDYAINAASRFHGIDKCILIEVIKRLVGFNSYGYDVECRNMGWLDESNSGIFITTNDEPSFYDKLPPLHRMLFAYSIPALTVNLGDDVLTNAIANVGLQYKQSSYSLAFSILNQQNVLKWHDSQYCIATPVVLDGVRVINSVQESVKMLPIRNPEYYTNMIV